MRIDCGLKGQKRKALVETLERLSGEKRIYEGAPTFAYRIGSWVVDKDGGLIVPSAFATAHRDQILERLKAEGFIPLSAHEVDRKEKMSVAIPLDGWTDAALENLQKLIESKASLIKKAFQCDSLGIHVTDEGISFPWFSLPEDAAQSLVYTSFISLLCKAAKSQTRVTAKERAVENEKYAMRCFLLRLGMIGDEYKDTRKFLLKNLSGNSAFKNRKEAQDEG